MLPECVGNVTLERRRTRALKLWPPNRWRADVRPCVGPRPRLPGYRVTAGSAGCSAGSADTADENGGPSRARESEMGEDPLNEGRVIDRGDELHPP
jgi:hypothetical protein